MCVVQQRIAFQVFRQPRITKPFDQHRACHGDNHVLEKQLRVQSRTERRLAVAYRQIDGIGLEIGDLVAGDNAQFYIGMCVRKFRQSRDQPLRREGRRHADGQVLRLGSQHFGRLRKQVESPSHIGNICTSRFGHDQRAGLAFKEFQSKLCLKPAYLLGHCCLCHAKFSFVTIMALRYNVK